MQKQYTNLQEEQEPNVQYPRGIPVGHPLPPQQQQYMNMPNYNLPQNGIVQMQAMGQMPNVLPQLQSFFSYLEIGIFTICL